MFSPSLVGVASVSTQHLPRDFASCVLPNYRLSLQQFQNLNISKFWMPCQVLHWYFHSIWFQRPTVRREVLAIVLCREIKVWGVLLLVVSQGFIKTVYVCTNVKELNQTGASPLCVVTNLFQEVLSTQTLSPPSPPACFPTACPGWEVFFPLWASLAFLLPVLLWWGHLHEARTTDFSGLMPPCPPSFELWSIFYLRPYYMLNANPLFSVRSNCSLGKMLLSFTSSRN